MSFAQRRQELIDAARNDEREPRHAVCGWPESYTEVAAIIDHNERSLPNQAICSQRTGRIANKQVGSRLPSCAPSLDVMRRRAIAGVPFGTVQFNDPKGYR